MSGNRTITLRASALVITGLILSSAPFARSADAPTVPPPQLQSIQSNTEVHGANFAPTPDDYLREQKAASEVVIIRVTSVSTQTATTESGASGALLVAARAAVTGVSRSATKLAIGSTIYILYGYVPSAPGAPAPPPTPILKQNTDYRAYLMGGPGEAPYNPAAGAQSFVDPFTPDLSANASSSSTTRPPGPFADPSLLPTPDNPTVIIPTPNNPYASGVPRLRGDALAKFVQMVQVGDKWVVSVAQGDPVALQTVGGAKPMLLTFYSAPARAPVTQPSVLIYQAGTQPAEPPAKGNVAIERALVFDSNNRALGDALWAKRVENNQRPLPLPVWRWTEYKVDIEDLDTHKVQTILFTGNPAPAPVPSPAVGTEKKN